MTTQEMILLALAGVNLATFAAFGLDKARSRRRGARRVPERTLLLLAALGGLGGAFAGRAAFRHKTQKQPFTALLWAIAAGEAALAGWWLAGMPLPA